MADLRDRSIDSQLMSQAENAEQHQTDVQLLRRCDTPIMDIEEWWPNLKPSTKEWLIENNGDAIPDDLIQDITQAGGSVASDASSVGEDGPSGSYLSDDAVDWIEAEANDEDAGEN
jgi:hypothetical protein